MKLEFLLIAASVLAGCQYGVESSEKTDLNGFGPIDFRMDATNAFEVSVWGRTYRYRDSVFPVSVKTAGREIFAAPMTLTFGRGRVARNLLGDESVPIADGRLTMEFKPFTPYVFAIED